MCNGIMTKLGERLSKARNQRRSAEMTRRVGPQTPTEAVSMRRQVELRKVKTPETPSTDTGGVFFPKVVFEANDIPHRVVRGWGARQPMPPESHRS